MSDFSVIEVKGNKKGFELYNTNKGNVSNGLDFLLGKDIYLTRLISKDICVQ